MADTIFTRALAQAAEMQRSNQALAYLLRVPENTLVRWKSGRAQMPLQAFQHLIELLVEHERSTGAAPQHAGEGPGATLSFNLGEALARCARCGGVQFASAVPLTALKMTSVLHCSACNSSVQHAELLADLATEAVRHSRAVARVRNRRATAALKLI